MSTLNNKMLNNSKISDYRPMGLSLQRRKTWKQDNSIRCLPGGRVTSEQIAGLPVPGYYSNSPPPAYPGLLPIPCT